MTWNLSENLNRSAQIYPNRIAYQILGETTSFAALNVLVNRFASALSARGIGKGDSIALLLGNSDEFVIAYYGILRTGAAVVPVNPVYTAREIEYILSNSQATGVVSLGALEPLIGEMKPRLDHLGLVIYTETAHSELTFDQFLQTGDVVYESPSIVQEDLAVILYTSGTTGNPKGAMLSHQNMASNAEAVVKLFQMTPEDRMVAVLPMFHVFCMTVCLNAPLACGATVLIVPKFTPTDVVNTIREQQATIFAGVPTMYNFMHLLAEPTNEDFSSIRLCISGGAPIPVALLHKFEERYGVMIYEGYGLSETAPVTAFNPLGGPRKPGSIGVDIPGVKNKVVDEEEREVPRGEVGELIVQGPNVMMGYLGMPEATKMALKKGWLYTGDLAKMDEDGYLYIVDRKKDMIIVGGLNVYAREVEEVLYNHPSIVEAAVIGVSDEEYGEAVKAFVVRSDNQLTEESVIQYCRDSLAHFKRPKYVEFVTELPKNSTGKILRRALRAPG